MYSKIKKQLLGTDFALGQKEANVWVQKTDFGEFQRLGEGMIITNTLTNNPSLMVPKYENKSVLFRRGFLNQVKKHWQKFKKQEKL